MKTPARTRIARIQQALRSWHRSGPRPTMPWQIDPSPYSVWVSEIMLQQTRVETAGPYYLAFLRAFPDVGALAAAELEKVLRLWSGLGYYGRARNLHRAAQILVQTASGELPQTLEGLCALPGIGRSTAGAILSLGMKQRGVVLDANVRRVLARLYAVSGRADRAAHQKQLWALAEALTPEDPALCADHAQAMMNLGALICTATGPACEGCPFRDECEARRLGRQTDFPERRPRKARPVRTARWLLLTDDGGRILVHQRPPTGIWGGLWSLPEVPEAETAEDFCQRLTGVRPPPCHPGAEIRHAFTHFELRARILQTSIPAPTTAADTTDRFITIPQALQQLPLPTPVTNLLRHLHPKPRPMPDPAL